MAIKTGLTEYEAASAVARLGSFRAAATELGMSTSALSHAVAALEARLGLRLFNRTTRSVSPTDAGSSSSPASPRHWRRSAARSRASTAIATRPRACCASTLRRARRG
jgi:DNA-binding transcriptional LysR family regulator